MKKLIFIAMLFCLPLMAAAQQQEQNYYLYNIVTFNNTLGTYDFTVKVDNGKTIESLKDEKGHEIIFDTPAGGLMYLISKGWELYTSGTTSGNPIFDNRIGANGYWILRKPCTKEDFEKTVKKVFKKEDFNDIYMEKH